ncbi:MAG: rhodanese-like domain-containing protein [Terrimesophilobacter sp.]
MIVNRYYIDCLSQASYLIGDETSGKAIVVDPRRDIAEFLDETRRLGLHIVGVINTHFHADFVAGHLEVAEATGAWIGYGSRAVTDYPIRHLAHGDHVSLGEVDIEVLETPGHTWESISLLVRDHASDPVGKAVLTGDALFIGDVGRPDLAAAVGADPLELARAQYHSITEVLMALPDSVRVLPAHGAGSACGKNLSTELESTIGAERRTNPSVAPMSEDAFVTMVTTGQPAIPDYFGVDALLNRHDRPLMAITPVADVLTPLQLRSLMTPSGTVVDTRTPDEFAAGHLRGSINIGIDGRFAETAGMVFDWRDRIAIIADEGRQDEVALRLGRIGFDNVAGYTEASASIRELADLGQTALRIPPEQLETTVRRKSALVVDVRNAGERELGAIPGSVHLPLADIRRRHAELPADRMLVVHCASGWRSSVAASFLRVLGHSRVADLEGGYNAWNRLQTHVAA